MATIVKSAGTASPSALPTPARCAAPGSPGDGLFRLPPLTDAEFERFQTLILHIAGVHLTHGKKVMVASRLLKRVRTLGLPSYGQYLERLQSSEDEVDIALDLLTTHETSFFREPKHFFFLRDRVLARHHSATPLRIWSAACSTGEEPYSIAMVLDESPLPAWELIASDVSAHAIRHAVRGHYALERGAEIPARYLKRHCRRGIGEQEGTFLIGRELRERINFRRINLNAQLPEIGTFDVIFLRNTLIYFQDETKRRVVARILRHLRPGGYILVGHSEHLHGHDQDLLRMERPSIYHRPLDEEPRRPARHL